MMSTDITHPVSSLQVPKEKRLLSVPKVTEMTEEQEKRSVNLGLSQGGTCTDRKRQTKNA